MKIRYVGKQMTADGKREFHNYRVFGGNRQSLYDWSQDLPEDERASAPASGGGSSARATAEPPIPENWSPLPPSQEASTQEKAASAFGEAPPF
jgi:hypothetical protein